MNFKRVLLIASLALFATTAQAQTNFNARTWLFTQNVTRAASEARFLQWFQAESLELNIFAREETNVLHQLGPLDLSATNLLHVWECAAETNIHTVFFAVTGTVEDATNGHVIYRVTPSGANLLDGNYLGFARVLQNVNGTNVRMGVLQQQRIQVIESVDSELYDIVGPISSTDHVQRIDYGGQSGATPQITRTGNVYNIVWPAAGAGDMLTSTYDTNANGVVDNAEALGGTAAAAYATDAEVASATSGIWTAIGTKIGASGVNFTNADNNGTVGTGSNQFARGSAVTDESSARTTADNIITVRVGVAEAAITAEAAIREAWDTTNAAVDAVQGAGINSNTAAIALIVNGQWSNRIEFLGVVNSNPCGLRLFMAYSGAAVHAVTGCTSYITIVDTNGPAATAGSNIVTVSAWPIYAAETWTAQYAVVEAFDIFDTATPLTQFGGLVDGGTATVDLVNFAPGATTWTTNSTLLLVGVTSIVPSAALSASNHLGVQIRPGSTVTNKMRLFVRGWR